MALMLYERDLDRDILVSDDNFAVCSRFVAACCENPRSGDHTISPRIAQSVSIALALLLIASGILQFSPSAMRPSIVGPVLLAAGIAILFGRSWGYYLTYVVAFATLLPPQRTWLVFVPTPIRRALWLYAGIEPELLTVLMSVLCVAALGWTHYVLHPSQRLDQPPSETTRRNTAYLGLVVSIGAVAVPVLSFIYWLILDPPGPGGPAAPGGGIRAFLVLLLAWPFMLAGAIGIVVCVLILKRNRPRAD